MNNEMFHSKARKASAGCLLGLHRTREDYSQGGGEGEMFSEMMTLRFTGKSEKSGYRITGKRNSAPTKQLRRSND